MNIPRERALFFGALLALVFIINLYPIYSLLKFGPYLFYENAFDEAYYLQYDFSLATQSPIRAGQYLVTLAHHLHLSGGWINFIFDLVCPVIFLVLVQKIFRLLKFSEKESYLNAMFLAIFPLLFSGSNPVIGETLEASLRDGWVYWITMPQAPFPPYIRTPEPQVSYLIMSIALYISLRYKTFWPVYLSTPFLYPFVGAPLLLVTLGIHIRSKLPERPASNVISILAAYFVVSLIFFVQLNFFLKAEERIYFLHSRAPLISFTSCVALILYGLFCKKIDREWRFPLLVMAVAPFCLVNQHIISGWFRHPSNFEHFFGTICCALIVIFIRNKNFYVNLVLCFVAVIFLFISAKKTFRSNYVLNTKIELNAQVLDTLRNHSPDVVVNDFGLASRLSMIFPKQPATLFGFQNTNSPHSRRQLPRYLCARKEILEDPQLAPRFSDVFPAINHAYHYESSDYVLLNSGRKKVFPAVNNVGQVPETCEERKLFPIFIK